MSDPEKTDNAEREKENQEGFAFDENTLICVLNKEPKKFTPRNIIRLMVEMLDPDEESHVLDPACGSGGFLVMVLDHVRKKIAKDLYPEESGALLTDRANTDPDVLTRAKEFAKIRLFGVDFDDDLKKAARMNMVMAGDGHANISTLNSLEYPKGSDPDLPVFEQSLHERVTGYEAKTTDASLGFFDYVFTNPPFGAKIPIGVFKRGGFLKWPFSMLKKSLSNLPMKPGVFSAIMCLKNIYSVHTPKKRKTPNRILIF